ncbi:MAG: hypothetical protein QXG65_04130 [Thermoplasmata archaeon]
MGIDPAAVAVVLLAGILAIGAGFDLAFREVPDPVWWSAAAAGLALGGWAFGASGPPLGLVAWWVPALVAAAQLVGGGSPLARRAPRVETALDLGLLAAAAVAATLGIAGGAAGAALPGAAVAGATILGRALFAIGAFGGGADVRAVVAMGLLAPLVPWSLAPLPATAVRALEVVPFAWTALLDASIMVAALAVGLGVHNVLHGEAPTVRAFSTYALPVRELPRRFVWPVGLPPERTGALLGAATAEEDRTARARIAEELAGEGIRTVRVTPQLPMVAFLAAGAGVALVAGNLLWDLAVALAR